MKICYIPGYESNYSRVKIFRGGLRENNVEVFDCSSNKKYIFKYMDMFYKFLKNKGKTDIILIGFFGQHIIFPIRLLTRKKIMLDAFMSIYDTYVFDKKIVKPNSFKAKFLYLIDKYSCKLANKVFLDTKQHINYFCSTFNLKEKKFSRIFIGADDKIFYPRKLKKKSKEFIVEFHGKFIPLQGVKYIIKAVKLLEKEKIKFIFIGDGQTFKENLELAKDLKLNNAVFLGKKDINEIPNFIAMSDVGLGIFGDTNKTKRVIPNKAYEILAMKKPLITSDTPASRELLKDKENVLFCKVKDPVSLAKAILLLKKNKKLRDKIALNGYKIFKENCTPLALGREIKLVANDLVFK